MKSNNVSAFLRFQAIGKATLIVLTLVLLVSCSKDEEPSIQAMLIGTWKLVSIDGDDLDPGFDLTIELEPDGDYRETFTEDGSKYTYRGEWALRSNKKDIDIDYDDGDFIRFELISVDKNELRVIDEDDIRYTFEKD